MTSASKKNDKLSNVFVNLGPMGPDQENRACDLETRNPDRPVSSGLLVPGEPGHCRARTRWPL